MNRDNHTAAHRMHKRRARRDRASIPFYELALHHRNRELLETFLLPMDAWEDVVVLSRLLMGDRALLVQMYDTLYADDDAYPPYTEEDFTLSVLAHTPRHTFLRIDMPEYLLDDGYGASAYFAISTDGEERLYYLLIKSKSRSEGDYLLQTFYLEERYFPLRGYYQKLRKKKLGYYTQRAAEQRIMDLAARPPAVTSPWQRGKQ